MCWALLCFMISFNLFIPELNQMITDLDGANFKGLLFIFFSITALISRPFSGKLSDTIGRKKVMYIGIVIGTITTLFYPVVGLTGFLMLRLSHGFSAGFLPTGATALVTDLLPEKGRGVGMGIWGTFISVGFGFGNFFSGMILKAVGIYGLFFTAAGFALLAGILTFGLKETLPNPQRFKFSLLKVKFEDVFEPTVLAPAFIMFCAAISTGVIFVTSPDISEYLGIENKGWFFIFYMSSTILVRLFAGSMSDKIGRRRSLIIGLIFLILSMILIATAHEVIQYTAGAIVYGLATGVNSPTIFAWTADLSPVARRGIGAGTVFIALEFAIMAGALITLVIYNNTMESARIIYVAASVFGVVAILYLLWHLRKKPSEHDLILNTKKDPELLDN
ncbi:MAG: MFS transporter [Crocinitomicaceae bacterium]|nr:MFS transporter [Crocinitomicaceae bacterium]